MSCREAIEAAARRLIPHIRGTPVLAMANDDHPCDATVILKLEFLQHSGSFKARGAFNRLLTANIGPEGVVAASGGNHGAAVALAAQRLGVPATIFVPQATPASKLQRIRAYGAQVVQGGAGYAAALKACDAYRARTGALGVHAYDDPAVLAGQGTVAREFEAATHGLTHVVVAVGGGGLVGGIGTWFEGSPTRVVAVEPASCPTLHAALRAGRPVPVEVGGVAADSLGARTVGTLAFDVAQRTGMTSVLVDDAAIVAAQRTLWDRLRIVAEPGGAAALAALLSGAWTPPAGSRVGVVLCGANTDPAAIV